MGSECQDREEEDAHLRPDQALCIWKQPSYDTHRRVDLVVTPYENYPVAILAWTGSAYFERSIRLYAKKQEQLKITSHGIYDRRTNEKLTERHAFQVLGLDWLEPHQRDC